MRRQEGLTLTGLMVVAVILIFVLLLGFRIGPPYIENFTINKQLKAIANEFDASGGPRKEIELAFLRRATIENIHTVSEGDLQIDKSGDRLVISADYSVRVPVVGNISACIDFNASSEK